jgi:hypothetical protein
MNTINHVKSSVSNMYERASDLCKSCWGRVAVVNIAEGTAGFAARGLLSPIGYIAGGLMGRGAAAVTVIGATGVVVQYSDQALLSHFPTISRGRRHIIVGAVALGVAHALNSLMTEVMTNVGGVAGEAGLGFLAALMAGYVVVRYLGSQNEVDMHRYAVGTALSAGASTFFELCVPGDGIIPRGGALVAGMVASQLA